MNDNSVSTLLNLGLSPSKCEERYQLQELLFEGGMGKVYKAYDSQTDRYVAYKTVKKDADLQLETRFRYEAEITARLEHPNIMPVYDIGQNSDGKPYYTMKLFSGQTLGDYLKNHHWQKNKNNYLDILLKVCDAVAFAHRNNIIHRDLKPENIIIGDYGEVLVLDWGIAKLARGKDTFKENDELISLASSYTKCGTIMGTPNFMAPEQTRDAESANELSDIYSLGATFLNIISGSVPFSEVNHRAILDKVRAGDVTFPEEHSSAVAVCKKAMAVNRDKRYSSVELLSLELRKLQGGYAVEAENPGLLKLVFMTFNRHKAVSCLSLFLILFVVIGSLLYFNRIKEQRVIAESQKKIAEKALKDLQKTSPVYLDRAKHSIAAGKFDDALIDIRTYLKLNQQSSEAYFLLGRIQQGKMNYDEATKAFEKSQELHDGPPLALCQSALHISKTAWAASSVDGSPNPNDQLSVYMSLVNNMQLPEAAALLDEILKNRKYSMQVYSALFKQSGLKGYVRYSKSGLMDIYLDKENEDISALKYFKKAHIGKLSFKDMKVSDVSVIKELNIHTLDISGTRVARLPFLKQANIKTIIAVSSRIQSLDDFVGTELLKLDLSQCPILDISLLSKFTTDNLNLAGCPAENPVAIKRALEFHKTLVLPLEWKRHLDDFSDSVKLVWSELEAPIVR